MGTDEAGSPTSLSMLAQLQQTSLANGEVASDGLSSAAAASLGGRFFQYRGVILLAFLALNLWLNISFIKPVVMGSIFAVVLFPLMHRFDRYKFTSRASATLRAALITIGFLLLILIPVGVLIFFGVQAVVDKIQHLDLNELTSGHFTLSSFADDFGLGGFVSKLQEAAPMSRADFQNYATKGLAAAAAFGASVLQDFIVSLPALAFSNLVLLFTMFFLLIDGPKAVHFIRHNSIFNAEQTDRIIRTVGLLCNAVIVATIISGAVQALIVVLFGVFLGAGSLILIFFITFISSFLPLIGTAPVILFLAIQAFANGETTHGFVWLASIAVVGVSDNVVRPYVLKGGAALHPLVAFVAAFGALNMIGFYGLFIGPIVAGMFFTLLPMVTRTYPRSGSALR